VFSSIYTLIKKILIVVLCLSAAILGAVFESENPEKISPVFWGVPFPSLSLGYYLIFLFLLGLFVGVILSQWATQKKLRASRRETKTLKKQVSSLALSKERAEKSPS